ncbi:MAG: SMP-30/gluconolactonase/LRE family protein [Curvibacter sp.]|nr:SMP-30/gluconolactonase/LRE family protein [Curvibacter sp.]
MTIPRNGARSGRARLQFLSLCGSLLLTACGGGGGGTSPTTPAQPSGLSLVAGRIDTLNGTGAAARFTAPQGAASDSAGNLYVTEPGLNIVRKITPAGVVSVLAGTVGIAGNSDGPAAQALFSNPNGLAVDSAGNVWVADTGNSSIRKISSTGVVSTWLSSLTVGSLAVDGAGNVYAAGSSTIYKISSQGQASPLAFSVPSSPSTLSLAVDGSSNLYIGVGAAGGLSSPGTAAIYKLTPNGTQSTVADFSKTQAVPAASFSLNGLAVDAQGNVHASAGAFNFQPVPGVSFPYVADALIKIDPSGGISLEAGVWGQSGNQDGSASQALFNQPMGLALDPQGNLLLADSGNNTIRRVSTSGTVSTLAGHAPLTSPIDGTGSAAGFVAINGLAADQNGHIAVAENSALRSLTESGTVSTSQSVPSAHSTYNGAAFDTSGNLYTALNTTSGSLATSTVYKTSIQGVATSFATGSYFSNLAADSSGNLFANSNSASGVLKISPTGQASSFAPTISFASALATDSAGNLYATQFDHTIVVVTTYGTQSLLAGTSGQAGYADGPAAKALFRSPAGIAVDASGNVYVADTGNNLIRKISPQGSVSTVAGSFGSGDTSMGTLPGALYRPGPLALDSDGSLLVAVNGTSVVRLRLP